VKARENLNMVETVSGFISTDDKINNKAFTNMSRFHIDPLDFAQMVELFEILLNLVESFFFLRRKGAVFVRYLCFAAQSVNEGNIRNETIFIFLVSQFIEKFCGVFLGDFITQVAQKVLKLSQHHGTIFILVV